MRITVSAKPTAAKKPAVKKATSLTLKQQSQIMGIIIGAVPSTGATTMKLRIKPDLVVDSSAVDSDTGTVDFIVDVLDGTIGTDVLNNSRLNYEIN